MTTSRSELGIGRRVRRLREELGMSTHDLDRMLGRSIGYTSRLETSSRNPRADTLLALAEALNVSIEWLVTGENEP